MDRFSRDVSRADERDRLVAAVADHAAARDIEFRGMSGDPPRHAYWASVLAGIVLIAAGWVGLRPPAFLAGPPPPALAAADLARGAEAALLIQSWQVEVFRSRQGRLPVSLEEVGVRLPGVRYIRSDARVYQLVAEVPGGRVIYDSALPDGGLAQVTGPPAGTPR